MTNYIKTTIQSLNSARIGSLSEYIFEFFFKSENLYRKHSERTDFILNGTSIDIKSKRNLNISYTKTGRYSGKRVNQIEYILVEYYSEYIVISKEGECLKKLEYAEIEQPFQEWLVSRNSKIHKRMGISVESLNEMKAELLNFFSLKGYKARIIYRTSQDAFGKESPGNLILKNINSNSVTVLILFKDFILESKNIKEIIAFRDNEGSNFIKIKKPQLHIEKVDLDRIENSYKYKSIEDLITNWI
jgi:hypothetical protein